MPIEFPEPPADVAKSIEKTTGPRRRRGLRRGRLEVGAAPAPEPPVPAQPVFTAGLDQLLQAGQAEETVAGPPSWRYSRFDAGGQAQAFEVVPGRQADPVVASGDDRFSPMIREALAIARDDPRVRDQEFEARLFRVPALNLLALWLHAEGTPDLFAPLGRAVPGVVPGRVYDHDEFLAALRQAAERSLSAYRDAERSDELGS